MTSEGHAYSRFRRALARGNPDVVVRAALELTRVDLADALQICWVLREDPERYERAAVRWLGRFALEVRGVSLGDVELAAAAFEDLLLQPEPAMKRVTDLCAERGMMRRRS